MGNMERSTLLSNIATRSSKIPSEVRYLEQRTETSVVKPIMTAEVIKKMTQEVKKPTKDRSQTPAATSAGFVHFGFDGRLIGKRLLGYTEL